MQKILADIKAPDKGQLAVSEEDGRFLRVLVATSEAKRALEIGGASGYSAIWIGMGLRETGGRLVTIEYDPVRAKELADNVKRAGLSDIVQVVSGDAFQQTPEDRRDVRLRLPRRLEEGLQEVLRHDAAAARQRRLFLAHNVVNKRNEMGDFLDVIWKNPALWTTIVTPLERGNVGVGEAP